MSRDDPVDVQVIKQDDLPRESNDDLKNLVYRQIRDRLHSTDPARVMGAGMSYLAAFKLLTGSEPVLRKAATDVAKSWNGEKAAEKWMESLQGIFATLEFLERECLATGRSLRDYGERVLPWAREAISYIGGGPEGGWRSDGYRRRNDQNAEYKDVYTEDEAGGFSGGDYHGYWEGYRSFWSNDVEVRVAARKVMARVNQELATTDFDYLPDFVQHDLPQDLVGPGEPTPVFDDGGGFGGPGLGGGSGMPDLDGPGDPLGTGGPDLPDRFTPAIPSPRDPTGPDLPPGLEDQSELAGVGPGLDPLSGPGGLGGLGPGGLGPGGLGPASGLGAAGAGGPGALGPGGLGAGKLGGAGAFPFMPMMPGGGGGQGGEERERTAWMNEDEDVWGSDSDAAPPVIG